MTAPTPPIPIADAHHHLWDLTHHRYPWLEEPKEMWIGDYRSLRRDYLVRDYRADCEGSNVVRSVHLQAMWDPSDPVGESRWLQACFEREGWPSAIVGYVHLAAPDAARTLEAHRQVPNVRGIRMDLNWHEDPRYRFCDRPDYMTDPQWLRGFEQLERHGFSFDLQVYAGRQAAEAAGLVRRFPGVQFILDHVGLPADRSPEGLSRWRDGLARLADLPNVAVKVSGLGMFDHQWTVDSLRPFILDALRLFGVGRCLFASNFPVDGLYARYDRLVQAYRQVLADLPAADLRAFFHDNAVRVYRIPVDHG